MSNFRNLIARTNPSKTLSTFIVGSSLGCVVTSHPHTQTRSLSIKTWRELIGIGDPIETARETAREYDNFTVTPDLQGDIHDVGPQGKILPKELWRTVVKLSCESSADGGICDVYLVGTCHVSKKSSQEVKAIIRFLKPQLVFLELCVDRMGHLLGLELKHVGRLGDFYGMEFRVAYEEARKLGSKVVLGDRRIEITDERYLKEILNEGMKLPHLKEILQEAMGRHHPDPIDTVYVGCIIESCERA